MFDRPASGENAILVQLDFSEGDFDERLAEFHLLASSAGALPQAVVSGPRKAPDAATFAGKGKVEEIGQTAALHEADLIIFNHELSAAQQRNQNALRDSKVLSRRNRASMVSSP